MSHLIPGEYDVTLNGVQLHYTVRGSGAEAIVHSGGPGMDAHVWDDLVGVDDFVTLVVIHPRRSGLSRPPAGDAYLLPDYAADVQALRLHLGLDKPIVMGWSPCNSRPPILIDYPKLIFFDTSADFGDIR